MYVVMVPDNRADYFYEIGRTMNRSSALANASRMSGVVISCPIITDFRESDLNHS